MANNLFTIAKRIRKQHPKKEWKDCVSMAARQMKTPAKRPAKKAVKKSAVGKVPKKAAAPKKVVIRVSKKGGVKATIGGTALGDISREQTKIGQFNRQLEQIRSQMKGKKGAEKQQLVRLRTQVMNAVKIAKQHITQLKKLI